MSQLLIFVFGGICMYVSIAVDLAFVFTVNLFIQFRDIICSRNQIYSSCLIP